MDTTLTQLLQEVVDLHLVVKQLRAELAQVKANKAEKAKKKEEKED